MNENTLIDSTPNATLEDGAWKDSFDKFLEEPRNLLREKQLLKKRVRASFNIDSSVENTSSEKIRKSKPSYLEVPLLRKVCDRKTLEKRRAYSVSTPNRLSSNPFKCSLSPIGLVTTANVKNGPEVFHATPINPNSVIIEFDVTEKSANTDNSGSLGNTPGELMKKMFENKTARVPKQVCFENSSKIDRIPALKENSLVKSLRSKSLNLNPGKWRKSLHLLRKTLQVNNNCRKLTIIHDSILNEDKSVEYIGTTFAGVRKSIFIKPDCCLDDTSFSNTLSQHDNWKSCFFKRCKQDGPLKFDDIYNANKMQNTQKIGEGAYGEVFLDNSTGTVLKIIPIEGKLEVNGEKQKTFEQILPEIVMSIELSKLRNLEKYENATSGFVGLKKVSCIQGKYPDYFIKLWEDYDKKKMSENDNPNIFCDLQLYVVLELDFSGRDLEAFVFSNAEQAYYGLQQIVFTLAVGEEAFQFEHRDLHWGNVLLCHTNQKQFNYKLRRKLLTVPSKGVQVTIIDYTLSRMTYNNCCFYNDLSCDEDLFIATGDYQFDIYRMMRKLLNNNWKIYEPMTNVYWISYIVTKITDGSVTYKNTRSKIHATYLKKLDDFKNIALSFSSAVDCVKYFQNKKISL